MSFHAKLLAASYWLGGTHRAVTSPAFGYYRIAQELWLCSV